MGAREDIELLDSKVARLKVEYEQYFMRVVKVEPLKLREEVERLILAYSNKHITNSAVKFRYNGVVAKYNAYRQYWTRVLRSIDEGTYMRKPEALPVSGGQAPAPGPADHPARAHVPPERHEPAPSAPAPPRDTHIEEVYRKYIEARRTCKEDTSGVSYEALLKTVEQFKKKVESQYKTTDIELKVYIKDGHAKLAMTPKK